MYTLCHFDTTLLKFSVAPAAEGSAVSIDWSNESKRHLLPLDMTPTPDGVKRWLEHRVLQKNRVHANPLLAKCGLSLNRPAAVLAACQGLSLSDSYWIREEGDFGTFDEVNLHSNAFRTDVAAVAFTGEGTQLRGTLRTPELTTGGALAKCWRRVRGVPTLYKAGFNGNGLDPFSEFYGSQVAAALGLSTVRYGLASWKGRLCSTCATFTSKETSFIPASHLVEHATLEKVLTHPLAGKHKKALADMVVLDAVIGNTDRHAGNFGVLVDAHKNKVISAAPLFDFGCSLFSRAPANKFRSASVLADYANTLPPRLNDDFVSTARELMYADLKGRVRALSAFRFHRHPRYSLPGNRLEVLEGFIRVQAQRLL